MKDIKVIFMGTPDFSVPILDALIQNTQVILVISAPDAAIGRKRVLTPCPVKQLALNHHLPVFSPIKIRQDYQIIKDLKPDLIITCAYGQIISQKILDIPRLGCINIHGSLLPKYRGGAPIHHALINGEKQTGITLMHMDAGMDSGDMIVKEALLIENNDNLATLSHKLSLLATKMIIKYLPAIIAKKAPRIKQDETKVSFAPIIKRADEHLDFTQTKKALDNLIRALSPGPYAHFLLDGLEYKIIESQIVQAQGKAGQISDVQKDSFTITCADGGIRITKIKPFGKSEMSVKDYLNGIKKENLLGKVVS